ncbi:MAG TPA: hypothetical protein VJS38_04540 [Phenylobacterium sp.]|uniref:hypothetical protein n=1 Tax=Phenylobacterium sp. TaxID=1871053 RepID=UPI002B48D743|nr:hypothetical protein [Phenylobacterium sp.]HKR87419.1 hypothetical protein [Phenylobacterium sp.]
MVGARVHYEVFGRRKPGSGWVLEMATEDRTAAIRMAENLIAEDGFAAAKVAKETLDEETREFASLEILKLGDWETAKKKEPKKEFEPLCVQPKDLYTLHARERIGRLLEDWLERKRATPFELLHRPDLVEALEASGGDLQHAVQKISVPEAADRGFSVHELIRTYNGLIERTIERLMKDWRRGALIDLKRESFAAAAERALKDPDPCYLLGSGVAGAIASSRTWSEKVGRLLDLAGAAPASGPARTLAMSVLEQPLAEILGVKPGLEDLIGRGLDLGGELAALTRLAVGGAVELLVKHDPRLAKVMPVLSGEAERLGGWLSEDAFEEVRTGLGKRILRELNGPRRLRPHDAVAEIDMLRGLAMSLTAGAGRLLPLEDVQAAFSTRSKMLVTGDFVDAYLGKGRTACEEAQALLVLGENVIGAANKRQASRWIAGVVGGLKFETEMRSGEETPAARLGKLAALQRQVGRCGLAPEDSATIQGRLGELGGMVEGEAKLSASIARAKAPPLHRLTVLLRLAAGESAPLGPAADRARSEALKLVRLPETRSALTEAPDQVETVRTLLQQAGLAA